MSGTGNPIAGRPEILSTRTAGFCMLFLCGLEMTRERLQAAPLFPLRHPVTRSTAVRASRLARRGFLVRIHLFFTS